MEIKKRGNKITFDLNELSQYLDKKIHEIGNFISNAIVALIIVSIMVVIQTFKASDIYLYGLILLPLVARGFVYSRIQKYLYRSLNELIIPE